MFSSLSRVSQLAGTAVASSIAASVGGSRGRTAEYVPALRAGRPRPHRTARG